MFFGNLAVTFKGEKMQKRLDLDDLLDNNKKIYVRNNALKSQLFMVVELKDKNGKNRALKVPPIRFPVSVSDQFSADSIRESSDLRSLIMKQILVLVDPVQAEKELASSEAREELKAFAMSVYADSAPSNAVRDTMETLKNKSSGVVQASDLLTVNNNADANAISNKVMGLIASFQSKEKSSKDTLLMLRRMKPTLTENDLTYIIGQCKSETTIREFAEGALAELAASPEQPFEE